MSVVVVTPAASTKIRRNRQSPNPKISGKQGGQDKGESDARSKLSGPEGLRIQGIFANEKRTRQSLEKNRFAFRSGQLREAMAEAERIDTCLRKREMHSQKENEQGVSGSAQDGMCWVTEFLDELQKNVSAILRICREELKRREFLGEILNLIDGEYIFRLEMQETTPKIQRALAGEMKCLSAMKRMRAGAYVKGGTGIGAWLRRVFDEGVPQTVVDTKGVVETRVVKSKAAMKYDLASAEIARAKRLLQNGRRALSILEGRIKKQTQRRKIKNVGVTYAFEDLSNPANKAAFNAYFEKRKRAIEGKKDAMRSKEARAKKQLHGLVWEIKDAERALSDDCRYGDWVPTKERKIVKVAVPDWSRKDPWHKLVEGPETRNPWELALERVKGENLPQIAKILQNMESSTGKDGWEDCGDVLSPLDPNSREKLQKEMRKR